MENQRKKIFLTVAILIGVLLLLITVSFFLASRRSSSSSNIGNFFIRKEQVSPTAAPTTGKLQQLSQPMNYKNIQVEYRGDIKRYAVYYTGSEDEARLSAEIFFASYGVNDIKKIPVSFIDINPITDTPPKGFLE